MKRNSAIGVKQEINVIDSEANYFGEFIAVTTVEGAIIVLKQNIVE
jgi:hypothetical protein